MNAVSSPVLSRRLAITAILSLTGAASAQSYIARILADNICCEAPHFAPDVAGAWGVTFAPTGPAWVAGNHSRRAGVLDGNGNPQGLSVRMEVPPLFNGGAATGLVHSPGANFIVTDGFGALRPARFIFATLEGSILAWAPRPAPLTQNTTAHFAVNNIGTGAVYTGIALAHTAAGDRLYVADLSHGSIVAFDDSFVEVPATFTDPTLPAGFAPFNIRVLGGRVLVAYGQPNAAREDVLTGPGRGIIDAFTLDGTFISRLATGGTLNAPWGMAIAPANFGPLSNALLVSNFGDGRINAFNATTGAPLGPMKDAAGIPLSIDGIRGIEFGNGLPFQAANSLYYGTNPTFGVFGEFGRIEVASCYANCDTSTALPVLNVNDFICFNNRFAAGDPYANCDGSSLQPMLNVNDFTCFLNKFAVGCP